MCKKREKKEKGLFSKTFCPTGLSPSCSFHLLLILKGGSAFLAWGSLCQLTRDQGGTQNKENFANVWQKWDWLIFIVGRIWWTSGLLRKNISKTALFWYILHLIFFQCCAYLSFFTWVSNSSFPFVSPFLSDFVTPDLLGCDLTNFFLIPLWNCHLKFSIIPKNACHNTYIKLTYARAEYKIWM